MISSKCRRRKLEDRAMAHKSGIFKNLVSGCDNKLAVEHHCLLVPKEQNLEKHYAALVEKTRDGISGGDGFRQMCGQNL